MKCFSYNACLREAIAALCDGRGNITPHFLEVGIAAKQQLLLISPSTVSLRLIKKYGEITGNTVVKGRAKEGSEIFIQTMRRFGLMLNRVAVSVLE